MEKKYRDDRELITLALVVGSGLVFVSALASMSILSGVHPVLAMVAVFSLAIVFASIYGCREQLKSQYSAQPSPETQSALEDVSKHVRSLEEFQSSCRAKIQYWQSESAKNLNALTTDGIRSLIVIQRISDAIDFRRQQLCELLEDPTKEAILQAAHISKEHLSFSNTSFDAVSGASLPSLRIEEIENALNELFNRVEHARVERAA